MYILVPVENYCSLENIICNQGYRAKLQNAGPFISISLNNKSFYCCVSFFDIVFTTCNMLTQVQNFVFNPFLHKNGSCRFETPVGTCSDWIFDETLSVLRMILVDFTLSNARHFARQSVPLATSGMSGLKPVSRQGYTWQE